MSLFTIDLARSCTLCEHVNGAVDFNMVSRICLPCGYEHKNFSLDRKKLDEEVKFGLISKKIAKKIVEQYEKDKGIPGQLRLTEGDDI